MQYEILNINLRITMRLSVNNNHYSVFYLYEHTYFALFQVNDVLDLLIL